MSAPERVPWPFPGPHYDWNTNDELGAITGQLRHLSQHAGDVHLANSLEELARDVEQVRQLVTEHVAMTEKDMR